MEKKEADTVFDVKPPSRSCEFGGHILYLFGAGPGFRFRREFGGHIPDGIGVRCCIECQPSFWFGSRNDSPLW